MNLLTRAKHSIEEIAGLFRQTSQARMAFNSRKRQTLPPPRAARVEVAGMGMIRIVDADSGQLLAMRQSYAEALGVAKALERGDQLPEAA
ncbi:hypothetical protein [Aquipseudomonas campi]